MNKYQRPRIHGQVESEDRKSRVVDQSAQGLVQLSTQILDTETTSDLEQVTQQDQIQSQIAAVHPVDHDADNQRVDAVQGDGSWQGFTLGQLLNSTWYADRLRQPAENSPNGHRRRQNAVSRERRRPRRSPNRSSSNRAVAAIPRAVCR